MPAVLLKRLDEGMKEATYIPTTITANTFDHTYFRSHTTGQHLVMNHLRLHKQMTMADVSKLVGKHSNGTMMALVGKGYVREMKRGMYQYIRG
jgi:hypothetical protein